MIGLVNFLLFCSEADTQYPTNSLQMKANLCLTPDICYGLKKRLNYLSKNFCISESFYTFKKSMAMSIMPA